jgi:large subunit ribosomal protein L22
MKVIATLNNLRMSPRKVRLVTDSIVGMDANAALTHLYYVVKKTSGILEKLLNSALANAENNFGLDKDNMFVSSVIVGEGTTLKRWLPRAQGRATQILKRTSHIKLEISERVEGKNRKSKEQIDKEKNERAKAKAKAVKEQAEDEHKREQEEDKKETNEKTIIKKISPKKDTSVKKSQDSGFLKKVFQRKSV